MSQWTGTEAVCTDPPQVANKKQRDNVAADAERKQRSEDLDLAAREAENEAPEAAGPADLLAAEEDEDVIF